MKNLENKNVGGAEAKVAALEAELARTIQMLEDANERIRQAAEQEEILKADKEILETKLERTQAKVKAAEDKVAELEANLKTVKAREGKAETGLVGAENAVLIQGVEGGAERAAEGAAEGAAPGAAQGANIKGGKPHRDESIDPPPSDQEFGSKDPIKAQKERLEYFRRSRMGLESNAAETSGPNKPKQDFLADKSRDELRKSMKNLAKVSAGSSENKGEKTSSDPEKPALKVASAAGSWVEVVRKGGLRRRKIASSSEEPAGREASAAGSSVKQLQEGAAGRGI